MSDDFATFAALSKARKEAKDFREEFLAADRHITELLDENKALTAALAAVEAIETYNDLPVNPGSLRYAATHQALCPSWITDVLMGLADVLAQAQPNRATKECVCTMLTGQTPWEPSEWEQAENCPAHPMAQPETEGT